MASAARSPGSASLTLWSIAALVAGLALGALGHAWPHAAYAAVLVVVLPLGDAWTSVLQATVLPLVVAHVLAAVTNDANRSVGALGARAVLLFVVLLVAAGLFTFAVAPPLIALYPAGPLGAAADTAMTLPAAARAVAGASPAPGGSWLTALVPSNVLEAALRGDVLPVLLFAAVFGLAVGRLPAPQRDPLVGAFRAVAAAMLVVVRWVLLATPVGVFALTYELALRRGQAAAGMLGAHVAIQCAVMLLATAALYPLVRAVAGVPVRSFARAAAAAQLVAVSTRSSLAALPALVDGARRSLALPPAATGVALPLAVATFKLNRTVSSTAKALFVAHVYGVPLAPGPLAAFTATLVLLSFGAVGVPGGGSAFKTLPAYLALGLPIEAIVLLEAVDAVPDVFKTLLNVTGDLAAATLLVPARATAMVSAAGAPASDLA